MRRRILPLLAALLAVPATAVLADSHTASEYPLRVHVFERSATNFSQGSKAEESRGQGRGDLFANGEAKAIDFEFICGHPLLLSPGYETFPAKWKTPGKELILMQPVGGKPGGFEGCALKVDVKDFVYVKNSGKLGTWPVAKFKDWMTQHNYDPEHGKTLPSVPAAK